MNKRALIAVLMLFLCSGVQAQWLKEGATAEGLKRDQSECDRKARAENSFNNPTTRGAGSLSGQRASNNMARENQASRLCMKSRGYAESADK